VKKTEVIHLLQHPEQITFREYEKLEDIATDYPFFTVLNALLAKASKNLNTPDQLHKLHTGALQSLNRTHFKKMMDFVPAPPPEQEAETDLEPEKGKDTMDLAGEPEKQEENSASQAEEEEGKASKDDDNDVLLSTILEVEDEKEPALNDKQKAQQEIIDSFINSNVGIIKADPENIEDAKVDLAKQSGQLSEDVISENFAKVLAKQGKIKKAVEMYEKLSLKYPEKSSYFASLIEKLQNK
jgi:hypothetical protein